MGKNCIVICIISKGIYIIFSILHKENIFHSQNLHNTVNAEGYANAHFWDFINCACAFYWDTVVLRLISCAHSRKIQENADTHALCITLSVYDSYFNFLRF